MGHLARTQGAVPQPGQCGDDGDQEPSGASDGRERRGEQPVGGRDGHADEEAGCPRDGRDGRDGKQPDEKDAGQRQGHGRKAEVVDLGRFGDFVAARRPEEYDAVELGEGQHDDAADQGQGGKACGRSEHVAARGDALEHPRIDQQLRDEAVERRQGADGGRADEKEDGCEGHVTGRPAQRIERRGAGLREHVAGAEKEQRLEERVVERVEQGACDAADGNGGVAGRFAQQGDADADEDHADVLDRRIGQQALHVVLGGGQDHAPQPGGDACGQDDQSGRAERFGGAERRDDTQDAVDARLDHHARHQGRDVRRRRGVRLGEPHVHGKESGFHAEAGQEDQKEG